METRELFSLRDKMLDFEDLEKFKIKLKMKMHKLAFMT